MFFNHVLIDILYIFIIIREPAWGRVNLFKPTKGGAPSQITSLSYSNFTSLSTATGLQPSTTLSTALCTSLFSSHNTSSRPSIRPSLSTSTNLGNNIYTRSIITGSVFKTDTTE